MAHAFGTLVAAYNLCSFVVPFFFASGAGLEKHRGAAAAVIAHLCCHGPLLVVQTTVQACLKAGPTRCALYATWQTAEKECNINIIVNNKEE